MKRKKPAPITERSFESRNPCYSRRAAMNPALETLLLPFSSEGGIPVPGRCLFLGAEAHPLLQGWQNLTAVQPHKPLADAWRRAGFTAPASPRRSPRWAPAGNKP